jgi:hypothetical protein
MIQSNKVKRHLRDSSKLRQKRYNAKKVKSTIKIKCGICQNEFTKDKAEYNRRINKVGSIAEFYCSKACQGMRSRNRRVPAIGLNLDRMRFGKLEVLDEIGIDKHGNKTWKCKCDCGKIVVRLTSQLTSGSSKNCGCFRNWKILPSGEKSQFWKGHKTISGSYWNSTLKSAKNRNLPFEITKEDVWEMFIKQNEKCALSGLLLTFGTNLRTDRTASIDRIDSSKGYTKENIHIVHKDVNYMKGTYSLKRFLEICSFIHIHNSSVVEC